MRQISFNKGTKHCKTNTSHITMGIPLTEDLLRIELLINKKLSKRNGKNIPNLEILHLGQNKPHKDHIPALQPIEQHLVENMQRYTINLRINCKVSLMGLGGRRPD